MGAMLTLSLNEIKQSTSDVSDSLGDFKNSFTSWKSDWTSARARKLDKLDGIERTVGDRASQTSVDTIRGYVDDLEARLTSTRASKLDNLDARVSTKANQTTADNIYSKVANGFVKRVQRGLIGGTQSTTIQLSTLVDAYYGDESLKYIDVTLPYSLTNTSKAVATCEHAIFKSQSGTFSGVACNLINSNTLRIYIRHTVLKSMDVITWQVVEYY